MSGGVILGIGCFVRGDGCIISGDALCLTVSWIRILMCALCVSLAIALILTSIVTFFSGRTLGLLVILALIRSFITCFIIISIEYDIFLLLLMFIKTRISIIVYAFLVFSSMI